MPAGEHAADQRHALEDHLLGVEPGDRREIAGFGDHQLGDRSQVGVQQEQETLGDGAQDVGGGRVGVPQQGGGGLQVGQHGLADDGAEQVLLGREVEVDRAFADAGGGGDVFQLGGGEAAVGEQTQRCLDDLAGAGFLAASAAAGQGLRCRWPWALLTDRSVSIQGTDLLSPRSTLAEGSRPDWLRGHRDPSLGTCLARSGGSEDW